MLQVMVNTTIPWFSGEGRFVQFPLEVQAESFEEIHRKLVDNGCIFGSRILFTKDEEGKRYITGRSPQIVGLHGLATITPMYFEFSEREANNAE